VSTDHPRQNVERRAIQTAPNGASVAGSRPTRVYRSTDQALCERLSVVAAGEQITDIVKTRLNC
jgi:hypothetical protein